MLLNNFFLTRRWQQYSHQNSSIDEKNTIDGTMERVNVNSTEQSLDFVCEKTQDRQISTTTRIFHAWEIPSCQNSEQNTENEQKYYLWSNNSFEKEVCSVEQERGKIILHKILSACKIEAKIQYQHFERM